MSNTSIATPRPYGLSSPFTTAADAVSYTHRTVSSEASMPLRQGNQIFWKVLLFFLLLGTLLPAICQHNFRTDILEQIMIGREWVLGSNKHPALTTWIAQIFWEFTGRADFAPYAASMFCFAIFYTSIWTLAKQCLSVGKALAATLALNAFWFYNLTGGVTYNNNVTLLAFWFLAISLLFFALKTGRKRFWILTGLALGLDLQCKYTAILLVFSMLIYMFLSRDARKYWKTSGPWLTILTAFLIFLPHFLFALSRFDMLYGYITRTHAADESSFLAALLVGWGLQLGVVLVLPLVLLPVFQFPFRIRKAKRKIRTHTVKRRFLLCGHFCSE